MSKEGWLGKDITEYIGWIIKGRLVNERKKKILIVLGMILLAAIKRQEIDHAKIKNKK